MHPIIREPAPLPHFKRIHPGDVGYIRKGCFHLLFSAGYPRGKKRLGVDVPRTFKPLKIGPIHNLAQPRAPGCLSTIGVRERLTPSASPVPYVRSAAPVFSSISNMCFRTLEPGSSFSFKLTETQGAALVTKHLTRCEDVELMGDFEKYTKDHYDSWVTFARETGRGSDIKPVLVTGVDITRDFAMMSYSNNDDSLTSEFTTSAPGVGSVWGTWRTSEPVHTSCGPYLPHPLSPTQTVDSTSSDAGPAEAFPDEDNLTQTTDSTSPGTSRAGSVPEEENQCVFVRYYTVRKRLGIPRVIKAAAGPHDLGPGGRDNEGCPLVEESDSDSDSDSASSLFDDDDDDRSSVTSTESESDVVVHNTTPVRFFRATLLFSLFLSDIV